MSWFSNLATRQKLFVVFGSMLLLLAVVVATARAAIAAILDSQKRLFETEFANATDVTDLLRHVNAVRADEASMLLAAGREEQEVFHEDIKNRSAALDQITRNLLERNRGDSGLLARIQELTSTRDAFARTKNAEVVPSILRGNGDSARQLISGVQLESFQRMRALAEDLRRETGARAEAAVVQSAHRAEQAVRV